MRERSRKRTYPLRGDGVKLGPKEMLGSCLCPTVERLSPLAIEGVYIGRAEHRLLDTSVLHGYLVHNKHIPPRTL